MLAEGLEILPERVGLIFISRTQPPPQFARLRAGNRVEFIGWNELRLTPEESEQMIHRLGRVELDRDTLIKLHAATDGWPAGLILLFERLKRRDLSFEKPGSLSREGIFAYFAGEGIIDLSPVSAFVAVVSYSVVLFLFASWGLEAFLKIHNLPAIPLVPVSSSQAIVGAVIGMGLLKGGAGISWRTVGGIAGGWVTTPVIAALMSFVALYFMQNVFQQPKYRANAPGVWHVAATGTADSPKNDTPDRLPTESEYKEFEKISRISYMRLPWW